MRVIVTSAVIVTQAPSFRRSRDLDKSNTFGQMKELTNDYYSEIKLHNLFRSSRIFFRKPMRFSGGGVVADIFNFPWSSKAYAVRWGGGDSAEFVFSVTSKRHFPLMGPFYIFLLARRGGARAPWAPPP